MNNNVLRLAEILRLLDEARNGRPDRKESAMTRALEQAASFTGDMPGRLGSNYHLDLLEAISEEDDTVMVFVYGTLKRGSWNNDLLRGARFVSEGVVDGYGLRDGLVPKAFRREGASVVGEIYAVDEMELARLDRLESYPYNYARDFVTVRVGRRGTCQAWIYVGHGNGPAELVDEWDGREWSKYVMADTDDA